MNFFKTVKTKFPRLALELIIGIAIFWGVMQWQERNLLADDGKLPAPELSAVTLSGQSWNLADYRGKKVVLYFFAPWCTVCHLSAGNLQNIYEAKQADDDDAGEWQVVLVALSYQHVDEVTAFVESHNFTMPILLGNANISQNWKISAFPTYYVVDAAGNIVERSQGYSTELGLRLRTMDEL